MTTTTVSLFSADTTFSTKLAAAQSEFSFFYSPLSEDVHLEDLLLLSTDVLLLDDSNYLGLSALDLCRMIRLKNEEVILILLGETFTTEDKMLALHSGADDLFKKPVHLKMLFSRVTAVKRRMAVVATEVAEVRQSLTEFSFNDLFLDSKRHMCLVKNHEVRLTNFEFLTLLYLVKHSEKTVARGDLLAEVWELPPDDPTRPVDHVISRLRQKLTQKNSTSQIQTYWGHGYRLEKL